MESVYMSTDQSTPNSENAAGELSDDVVESVKVQENDGTYHASIPKDVARDLGIEKGDRVVYTGQRGERTLRLQKSSAAIFSDD